VGSKVILNTIGEERNLALAGIEHEPSSPYPVAMLTELPRLPFPSKPLPIHHSSPLLASGATYTNHEGIVRLVRIGLLDLWRETAQWNASTDEKQENHGQLQLRHISTQYMFSSAV
jgi:hypothetical protein